MLSTLLIIFLCGGAVGATLTRTFMLRRWNRQPTSTAVIERARHMGLNNLRSQLNLTPEQMKIVNKTLDDYGKFYQNIEDEREDTARIGTAQILEVLTPEQRERFNYLIGHPPEHQ